MIPTSPIRGFTLVEVAVVLVIAGIMFFVLGQALTGVTIRTNQELMTSVGEKIATSKLQEAAVTPYSALRLTESEFLTPVLIRFQEGAAEEEVSFGIERRVIVAPRSTGELDLRQVEIRVFWPESAPDDPSGEVIKSIQVGP